MLHEQQMVNALLQQLDAHHETSGLLIIAATNRFDDLDPAVIREGASITRSRLTTLTSRRGWGFSEPSSACGPTAASCVWRNSRRIWRASPLRRSGALWTRPH
jgi:hypothetical protein